MTETYYDRKNNTLSVDGLPLYQCKEDEAKEQAVAKRIEAKWHIEAKPFGWLCPVDYYFLKNQQMVAVAEIKVRTHASTKYDTVFLNLRKWLALVMAQAGMGVPAIYFVQFTDRIKWIVISNVQNMKIEYRGCLQVVKTHTDVEPVFLVPIDQMKSLE